VAKYLQGILPRAALYPLTHLSRSGESLGVKRLDGVINLDGARHTGHVLLVFDMTTSTSLPFEFLQSLIQLRQKTCEHPVSKPNCVGSSKHIEQTSSSASSRFADSLADEVALTGVDVT